MHTSKRARLALALLALVVASCQSEAGTQQTRGDGRDTAGEGAAGDSAVGVTSAALITGNFTYTPIADTVLRAAIPFGNDGTGQQLGVTSASVADVERSIIRFNQTQIRAAFPAGRVLQSARLDIVVTGISAGWLGAAIDLHAMNREWVEGTGLAGNGASWVCANDTNTTIFGLGINDCSAANNWSMTTPAPFPRPFNSAATDRVPVFTGGLTRISFDVTEDVRAIRAGAPHFGWMLGGAPNLAGGEWVHFGSREAAVANRPQLIINYGTDDCPADPNKGLAGACGCGNPDLDTNLDNVADCFDAAVPATGDAPLRVVVPFANDGTGLFLPATSASIVDIERSLVKVSNAAIDAARHGAPITKAYLELTVAGIAVGWAGGQLALHRMNPTPVWVEGTGLAGHGVTWACADDSNTTFAALGNDCVPANDWYMSPFQWTIFPKPYQEPATGIVGVTWPGMNSVRFDVTADVQAFLANPSSNNGWILQGNASTFASGNWVNFGSRESGAPPRLLIDIPNGCPSTGKIGGPGQCGCAIPETDRDTDTVPDCIDECPDNSALTKRGVCGCDAATDSDGDGLANCVDPCPNHNDPTLGGKCRCPDDPAPEGTVCEGPCGGGGNITGFDECDGAGHCGDVTDPVTCPKPDPTCASCSAVVAKDLSVGGGYTSLWTCACPRGGDVAANACSSLEGHHLVRIDSPAKNAYVRSRIDSDTWIGANDRTQEGRWEWSWTEGFNGERFWDGGNSGSRVGGRYENWQTNEPGGGDTEDCAAMLFAGTSAEWQDRSCGQSLDFICERGLAVTDEGGVTPTFDRTCVKIGTRCLPSDDDLPVCIDEDALPGAEESILMQQQRVDQCETCTDLCDGCPEEECGPPPTATQVQQCRANCASVCVGAAQEATPANSVACVDDLDNYEVEPGIFTNPPPEKHCAIEVPKPPATLGALTPCVSHAQCQFLGAGSHCGEVAHCRMCNPASDPGCVACNGELEDSPPPERPNPPDPSLCDIVGTADANQNICVSHKFCGEPIAECFLNDTDPVYCAHYELCVDPENDYDLPGPPDAEDLQEPSYVTPDTLFPVKPEIAEPDPFFPEDTGCSGASCEGPDDASHPWCHYDVTDVLGPQTPQTPTKEAKTGNGSVLTFNVDPGVDLTYATDIGPLGMPLPVVGASAHFVASGAIEIFKIHDTFRLIDIQGGARGGIAFGPSVDDRVCGFKAFARAEILGIDVLPEEVNFRQPDMDGTEDLQETCLEAVDEFRVVVDSARKAFADAREIVTQYRDMKAETPPRFFSDGSNSTPSLCEQLAISPPRGFPVFGDCETEHPAVTINRFIEFYNNVAIQRVRTAAAELGAKLDGLVAASGYNGRFEIIEPISKDEQITLFNTTFLIGPVPANLEVLLTTQYGVDAYVLADFRIGQLMGNLVGPALLDNEPVFKVGVDGGPAAGIGLSLFAGVGFDLGFASAKLGIDGAIDLGHARLPVKAWAGIGVGTEVDPREPPMSWEESVDVTAGHLIPTQRLAFNMMWNYESDLELNHVLSGSLGLALKIKFFFFSKRWRKTIITFKGLCPPAPDADRDDWCTIPLFRNSATSSLTWGEIQLPMPFYPIKPLTFFEVFEDPIGTATFDDREVGKVFYDSLCQCIPPWSDSDPPKQDCFRREDCCGHEVDADLRCFTNPSPVAGVIRSQCTTCRQLLQTCNGDDDCCGDGVNYCFFPEGSSSGVCLPKSDLCEWCADDDDCLSTEGNELECSGGACIEEANSCEDPPEVPR